MNEQFLPVTPNQERVAELRKNKAQQQAATRNAATQVDPELEARIDRVQEGMNIDSRNYAAENVDHLSTILDRQQAESAAHRLPVTESVLANPDRNGAAQDDIEGLSFIERHISGLGDRFERGQQVVELSEIGFAAFQSGAITDEQWMRVAQLEGSNEMASEYGEDSVVPFIAGAMAEQGPIMGNILWEAKEEAAVGAAVGFATPVPIGTLAGAGTGLKYGSALAAGRMEAGLAFLEIMKMKDSEGNPIPVEAAQAAAGIVGFVNGGLELVTFGPMMRLVPGGDKVMKAMGSRELLTIAMKRPGVIAALQKIGKRIAVGSGAEAGQESLQEGMQLLGQEIAAAFAEGEFDTPDAVEYGQAMTEGAKMGAAAAFGFGVTMSPATVTIETQAQKLSEDKRNAFEAMAGDDSKLRERAPDRLKQFVAAVKEKHGTVENIYLDPDAAQTFFQQYTEEEIEQRMPGTWESLSLARQNGSDVVIPIEEFITYIAPNVDQISGDLKFAPDELTANQMEQMEVEVEAKKQEILKELSEGGDVATIFEDFKAKLMEVGYTGDAASAQAMLVDSVINSLAEAAGTDAKTFYEQFSVDIQNELKEGDASLFTLQEEMLEQSAFHGTPHDISPAITVEDRETGRRYVTTQQSYDIVSRVNPERYDIIKEHPKGAFSLDKIGTGEGAQAYGWGLYFSGDKSIAEYYRDALSEPATIYINGEALDDTSRSAIFEWANNNIERRPRIAFTGILGRLSKLGDVARTRSEIEGIIDGLGDGFENVKVDMANELAILNQIESMGDITFDKVHGNLYEVDIPEDRELLDYDGTMAEQSEDVLEKIRKAELSSLDEWEQEEGPFPGWTGRQLYAKLSEELGGDREASQYLNELGIKGLTYIGGTSDQRNYVVWDEDVVDIRAKNNETLYQQDTELVEQDARRADATMLDMEKAPTITMQDLVGRKVQFIMADLTSTGQLFSGQEGLDIDPVATFGGPGFPFLKIYDAPEVGWVFRGQGKVTQVLNLKAKQDADVVVVLAMGQDAHQSNSTVALSMVRLFDAAIQDGRINDDDLSTIMEKIRSRKAYPRLADTPDLHDHEAAHKFLDDLTFEERAEVMKVLAQPGVQSLEGVPTTEVLLRSLMDKEAAGVNLGDSLLAFEISDDNPRVDFKDEDIPLHPDYQMGVRGKPLGKFKQPINWNILLADEFKARGKPVNAFNVDRIRPVVEITQEMADKAASVEALESPSAAIASLASALAGNWADTTTPVNKGGVSHVEVERAIKNSDAAPTLTHYTADEIRAGKKDGSLVFHKLANSANYVGIKRGGMVEEYAGYGLEHVEITEDDVGMVGVINNTPGARGLGPASVMKGIEEGVTILDAFALPTVKYPNGQLPTFYEQFGFETIAEIPFDEEYLTDAHVQYWETQGWSREMGLPPIVVMKWRGRDSDRAGLTERIIAEGAGSVPADGTADPATVESLRADSRAATGQADTTDGDGGGAGGFDRDRAVGAASRLVSAARELPDFDPRVADLYGVDNETQLRLQEKFGVRLSQNGQTVERGYIQFPADTKDYFRITLTSRADLSTFLHEAGHMFLELMHVAADSEGATDQIKLDLALIRDHIGAAPGEKLTRDNHEKFARMFEAYLMEGKSPNARLAEVFRKFKSWLTSIYRTIQAVLDIEGATLTDEVVQVMDRLVGVEAGFAAQMDAIQPAFADAEAAGMTEPQYQNYLEAHRKAVEEAKLSVEREAMADARRTRSADYRARKEVLTKSITEQLDAVPAQRVIRFLTAKTFEDWESVPEYLHGYKLDTELVKQVMGVDIIPAKLRRLTSKDTALSPDELAPLFGFASGLEMMNAMAEAPPRAEAIRESVQGALREEFGDYRYDPKMDSDIVEALHNNPMGEHIMAEVRAIGRRIGNPINNSQMAIARLAAREHIAKIPIYRLDPRQYLSAERRARKKAADAIAAGNYDEAMQYKLRELSNHQMYRAANDAKKQGEVIRKSLAKTSRMLYKKGNYIGKAGDHYRDAILSILEKVELRPVSKKGIDRRTQLADYIAKIEADGDTPAIPDKYLTQLGVANYKEMPLDELQSLHDTVNHLKLIAKRKTELLVGRERKRMAEVVDGIVESMGKNQKPHKGYDAGTLMDKFSSANAALTKIEFILEWIDGRKDGLAHRTVFQPIANAQHAANDRMKALSTQLREAWKDVSLKVAGVYPRTAQFLGEERTIEEVYAIALNMGNEGNLTKMLESEGWSKEQLISEFENTDIVDWDVVQRTWDIVNSMWQDISDVQMRVHGVRPKKVEASQLVIGDKTLKGGYYPVVYDPRRRTKHSTGAAQADDLFENNLFKPNVSSGFTEARTQFFDPLLLNLSVLDRHLAETVHFVTHYEAVRNAEKLFKNDQFAAAFKEHFGYQQYKRLMPWLTNIANAGKATSVEMDALARHARTGLSMTAMGMSTSTGIIQLLGLPPAVAQVGPARLLTAMAKAPLAWSAVNKMSGEMRHLLNSPDRDIRNATQGGAMRDVPNEVRRFSFLIITGIQKYVSVATWLAAYDKAIAKGADHESAVQQADQTVRVTQSGAGEKDLASVQIGSELQRLFTPFYSYFSVLYNAQREMARDVRHGRPLDATYKLMWVVLIPTLIEIIIRGDEPDEDEDESFAEFYAKRALAYSLASIPFVGSALGSYLAGYDPRGLPAIDNLGKAAVEFVEFPGKLAEGEVEAKHWSRFIEAAGTLTILPTKPITRAIKAAEADDFEEAVRIFLLGQQPDD